MAGASPKKKPARHVVTRQLFALPVLQQFEPVLATSPRSYMVPTSTIPKIETTTNNISSSCSSSTSASISRPSSGSSAARLRPTSPAAAVPATAASPRPPPMSSTSPGAPPHRPRDRESSPRVLRPQLPPPLGISARADVDIYRYNQSTAQRMAICPLFEQRKEDEAQIAREILAQRNELDRVKQSVAAIAVGDSVDTEPHDSIDSAPNGSGSSRWRDNTHQGSPTRLDDEGALQEFTAIKFVSPRSADGKTLGVDVALGLDPQPADSAEALRDAAPIDSRLTDKDTSDALCDAAKATDAMNDSDRADAVAAEPPASERQLVQPLVPGHYHEPFRAIESDRASLQIQDAQSSPVKSSDGLERLPSATTAAATQHAAPAPVLYKELWSERNRYEDYSATIAVLLSSEATVHIVISNVAPSSEPSSDAANERETQTIRVSDVDIALSKQLRPDLRVLTRKWAAWLLTRVERDASGTFYVQLNDAPALEQCYTDSCVSLDGCQLSVEMHIVSDASLLVSVCDVATGATSKLFLNEREIRVLAVALGRAAGDSDAGGVDVATLMRDPTFLAQLVTKSSVVRLGRKSSEIRPHTQVHETRHNADNEPDSDGIDTEQAPPLEGVSALPLLDTHRSDLLSLLHTNSSLAAVAFLAQVYTTDGMASALRHLQQHEAAARHAQSYVLHRAASASSAAFSDLIAANVEAAKLAKLTELAITSIVDDLVTELIAFESRVELYDAKHSGKYDDHYASKVQATYRMSTQRKQYALQKFTRARAVRLLQALQRGVSARRRYAELKAEREKYLFYGFRASLYSSAATAPGIGDPKTRAQALADETERKRLTFLLQVLDGYALDHGLPEPYRIPAALIETLINEFGVVVGCPGAFGATVATFLQASADDTSSDVAGDRHPLTPAVPEQPLHLYSSRQIHAALVLALRSLYDDTFGLSATTRRLVTNESRSVRAGNDDTRDRNSDEVPPRWLLKLNAPFQRANRTRVAALRLARKTAGRKACHLVVRDYQRLLASEAFSAFESCREAWEASIRTRRTEQREVDASSRDDTVQRVLDLVISSIKDWGVDPEPLFAGLNLCVRHRQGKAIVAVVEAKFNAFADDVDKLHGKRNIVSLRDEIEHELEDFERLVALRCLNIGRDHVVTVPPSEILHIVLHGRVDDEYVRHALPTVLPIASLVDKYALVRAMVRAYANESYGEAINAICYSCLDVAEHVTVEAAQLLDRITRVDPALDTAEASSEPSASSSVASRALYLLTGAPALAFVQFLAKVAQFNRTTQHRTLALLAPYAERYTLFRIASAVARLDDYDTTAELYDRAFAADAVYACSRFWGQYEALYGLDAAECARASRPDDLVTDVAGTSQSDAERSRGDLERRRSVTR